MSHQNTIKCLRIRHDERLKWLFYDLLRIVICFCLLPYFFELLQTAPYFPATGRGRRIGRVQASRVECQQFESQPSLINDLQS